MEKLLDLVQKLRENVVPTAEISKISKKELLQFIEDANILKKMEISVTHKYFIKSTLLA